MITLLDALGDTWRWAAPSESGLVHNNIMQKVETTLSTLGENLARSAVA